MPDMMVDVYKGLIEKSDPFKNFMTGYALRQQLQKEEADAALKQRKLELDQMEFYRKVGKDEADVEMHEGDMLQKTLDRLQRSEEATDKNTLKGIELKLKDKEINQNRDIANQRLSLSLAGLKLRVKEFEQKSVELGNEVTVKPLLTRLQQATAEANNLRDAAYGNSLYITDEQRAKAEADLENKMKEVNNITDVIDRMTLGNTGKPGTGMSGAGIGPLSPENQRKEQLQKNRDERIAGTEAEVARQVSAANIVINTKDKNPTVAKIKQEAAVPLYAERQKTINRINEIKARYYKQLETDPNVAPPKAQIDAVLYNFKWKVQGMIDKNRYLRECVQEGRLNSYLFGGEGPQ